MLVLDSGLDCSYLASLYWRVGGMEGKYEEEVKWQKQHLHLLWRMRKSEFSQCHVRVHLRDYIRALRAAKCVKFSALITSADIHSVWFKVTHFLLGRNWSHYLAEVWFCTSFGQLSLVKSLNIYTSTCFQVSFTFSII